jgi:hypothetical protein
MIHMIQELFGQTLRHIRKIDFRALSVIYITDTTVSQAHNPNWSSLSRAPMSGDAVRRLDGELKPPD